MHRTDDSEFLLYLEPFKREKLTEPVKDAWSELMHLALMKAKEGTSSYGDRDGKAEFRSPAVWLGVHETDCGQRSSNQDYLLENGMITNSLAVFYLQWYRNSIPDSEWNKLRRLAAFYKHPVPQETGATG